MSLLTLSSDERLMNLSQVVFEKQFEKDQQLKEEYDSRRKRWMMHDTRHNLQCLDVALRYNAPDLFYDNALWIYELLAHRMTDISNDRLKQQLIDHYELLASVVAEHEELDDDQRNALFDMISKTVDIIDNASSDHRKNMDSENEGQLADIRSEYINHLLNGKRHSAHRVIQEAVENGVSLEDVLIEVLQQGMYKVGQMWHKNQITVDKEHYCTAVTQGIISSFYSQIFATAKLNRTLLACCVGSELHEMGIRMVCDLFELNGWDSVYLGASLPPDAVLSAVQEHNPDLVALSVTMIHHIDRCKETVDVLREYFKDLSICVGGRVFDVAPELADGWGVDLATSDVRKLLQWSEETFV